jgi:hypothetical protein
VITAYHMRTACMAHRCSSCYTATAEMSVSPSTHFPGSHARAGEGSRWSRTDAVCSVEHVRSPERHISATGAATQTSAGIRHHRPSIPDHTSQSQRRERSHRTRSDKPRASSSSDPRSLPTQRFLPFLTPHLHPPPRAPPCRQVSPPSPSSLRASSTMQSLDSRPRS